jgi:hypothetical protein
MDIGKKKKERRGVANYDKAQREAANCNNNYGRL